MTPEQIDSLMRGIAVLQANGWEALPANFGDALESLGSPESEAAFLALCDVRNAIERAADAVERAFNVANTQSGPDWDGD